MFGFEKHWVVPKIWGFVLFTCKALGSRHQKFGFAMGKIEKVICERVSRKSIVRLQRAYWNDWIETLEKSMTDRNTQTE
jgi:hypothetical protein